MRKVSTLVLMGMIAILATTWVSPTAADPAPVAGKEAKPGGDWKEDPASRMVFFAVLEGLYTDGVSSEAVDGIIGKKTKDGKGDIKATFVIECPLCHPVYEAFCLYRQRPAFSGEKGTKDTLGKGLDAAT